MKTANLTGPLLDFWVARAEGVPAAELELRGVPRTDNHICVRHLVFDGAMGTSALQVLDYSTNWALAGPLLDKRRINLGELSKNWCEAWMGALYKEDGSVFQNGAFAEGETPRIAICRAVVRAAFGDEVEELSCQ